MSLRPMRLENMKTGNDWLSRAISSARAGAEERAKKEQETGKAELSAIERKIAEKKGQSYDDAAKEKAQRHIKAREESKAKEKSKAGGGGGADKRKRDDHGRFA